MHIGITMMPATSTIITGSKNRGQRLDPALTGPVVLGVFFSSESNASVSAPTSTVRLAGARYLTIVKRSALALECWPVAFVAVMVSV
jgi:hypothetical protein